METYIWQRPQWPNLTWDDARTAAPLAAVNTLRGVLLGRLSLMGIGEQDEHMLDSLTREVIHSSEIEGEELNRDSVRSSLARHLGIDIEGMPRTDHYTDGVVQVTLDATQNFHLPLTPDRLFRWHRALFPYGQSGIERIAVGEWRTGDEPMQVVSGPFGRQRVHFEAPPSDSVPRMMSDFLSWVENPHPTPDPIALAAVAHLWFVSIHPFDDGNGRICRAITELLLSRADASPLRAYSISSAILSNRKEYYDCLESAQRGGTDVTDWVLWFVETLRQALSLSLEKTERVVRKKYFWDAHTSTALNDRQRKVINMLLDGFEGKLTSSKWYKICHCSQDTASRDINDLISKNILRKTPEGGRSAGYELVY